MAIEAEIREALGASNEWKDFTSKKQPVTAITWNVVQWDVK